MPLVISLTLLAITYGTMASDTAYTTRAASSINVTPVAVFIFKYISKLITHGYESKDIAKILRISERTVQGTHVCSLHSKLYTRNRVQLALYALRNGLVRLEDVTLIPTGEAA